MEYHVKKITRDFLERYNKKGLSGVYELRDELKLAHKDSLYHALMDNITRHFERVVGECTFGERFCSIEDKIMGEFINPREKFSM